VTIETDWDSSKHDLPSISIDEGMKIDERDEQNQNVDSEIDESMAPGADESRLAPPDPLMRVRTWLGVS
jgi:hypothetical protein